MKNGKKLKNMNIFMDKDFCPETTEYRKQFWEEVKKIRRKVMQHILTIDR